MDNTFHIEDESIESQWISILVIEIHWLTSSYNLYYCLIDSDDNDDEQKRSECVKLFSNYHLNKFIHYFDVEGYVKFLVDFFFERSSKVFNQIYISLQCQDYKPLVLIIIRKIVDDKRFIQMNQSDIEELKRRIDSYSNNLKLNRYNYSFNYNYLYEKDNTNNNKVISNSSNNNNKLDIKTTTNSTTITTTQKYILSDLVLKNIISKTEFDFEDQRSEKNDNNKLFNFKNFNTINLALVSKRFFNIVSKIINNLYYGWYNYFNIDNKYCLIKKTPLLFDYESIKYIRYDRGAEYANRMTSRVETFHIESDEIYSTTGGSLRRDYLYSHSLSPNSQDRTSILLPAYLVHPPPMPNLKNIVVHNYMGFREN
ncbi:hypothetical protein PPL_02584 [Heterostelium album PN500]|uniref:F-box domain-containing protein n=1 Tax=Heterostelium pallidum (strain ATCC 26659 / Pp 5 / PN500) TaxID=670386 RepID=D3B2H1_HETP5|nr:hypothetical protein PPL_02584 [Heterostelium album PN500]EFA83519.1 hypothetical protein PPL_02584 [Heterostelium album PN500]|eukprot:XP_020435636.1 hypothetical protein PPL_02584 [Heterostelium album PN500]